MVINEVMTRDVKVAAPSDDLQHAAQLMARDDFGSLPVRDGNRLVGMLSDRDIAIRAVARGLSPLECKVRDIMSGDVKYVFNDESVEDAAKKMGQLQVRRLPVLDREQRLVGIVSLGDLALTRAEPAGDALKSISEPS